MDLELMRVIVHGMMDYHHRHSGDMFEIFEAHERPDMILTMNSVNAVLIWMLRQLENELVKEKT